MIKLLLADDHQVFREGLAVLLKEQPDMKICAEANNGNEILEILKTQAIDVIIMDIKMPEMNGMDCAEQITTKHTELKFWYLLLMITINT